MNASVLTVLGGTSTALGLLAILAYFYISASAKAAATQSIKGVIGINQSFDAKQIVNILEKFSDDKSRIDALRQLTELDKEKAILLVNAAHNNEDLQKIIKEQNSHKIMVLKLLGTTLIIFGVSGLVASAQQRDRTSAPTALVKKISESKILPDLRDWKNVKAKTRDDIEVNGGLLDFVNNERFLLTVEPSEGRYSSANVVFKDKGDLVRTYCVSAALVGSGGITTLEVGSKDGLLIVTSNYSRFMIYETEKNFIDWTEFPSVPTLSDINGKKIIKDNTLKLCFEEESMTAFIGTTFLGTLTKKIPYVSPVSQAGVFIKSDKEKTGKAEIRGMLVHRLSN